MTDRYSEALDFQMELARKLQRDRISREYVSQIVRQSNLGKVPPSLIGSALANSHTYFITDEMVDLVTWASTSMPEHPLQPSHLPAPYGFAWLEKSVTQPDSWGEPLSFRAVSWSQSNTTGGKESSGILLCLYGDLEELDPRERLLVARSEEELAHVRRLLGRVHLTHLTPWRYGQDWVTPSLKAEIEEAVERGQGWGEREPHQTLAARAGGIHPDAPKGRDYDTMLQAVVSTNGWATALWAVMGQDLGRPEATAAPRAARKRAERAGKAKTEINIVHLRRNMGGEVEETNEERADGKRKVKVRYWVKPFWRRQWYPKQQVHRLILIPPHERGPADAPLSTKGTIRVLDK